MGENSDVTLGSMLVPEAMNPTEFSIAAIPGMFPCAVAKEANIRIQGKTSTFVIPHSVRAPAHAKTSKTVSEVRTWTRFGESIQ
jgi:hypothetical protein